jgi:hypothetical protein
MMKFAMVLLTTLTLLWAAGARAKTIFVHCEIDQVWDEETGRLEPTSGADVFVLTTEGEAVKDVRLSAACVPNSKTV